MNCTATAASAAVPPIFRMSWPICAAWGLAAAIMNCFAGFSVSAARAGAPAAMTMASACARKRLVFFGIRLSSLFAQDRGMMNFPAFPHYTLCRFFW